MSFVPGPKSRGISPVTATLCRCAFLLLILSMGSVCVAGQGAKESADEQSRALEGAGNVALSSAKTKGEVKDGLARFSTEMQITSYESGRQVITLFDGPVAVTDWSVETSFWGGDGYVMRADSGVHLVIVGSGQYSVSLDFVNRVSRQNGRKKLDIPLVQAVVSETKVTIPRKDIAVDVQPSVSFETETAAEETTVTLYGGEGEVTLSWQPRAPEKVTEPVIFAEQRMVLGERRRGDRGTPLISSFASDTGAADEWYEFREAGTGHKLGRVVQVIEIRPRDSFRYGHRLWLDEATAMPLKVQLLDPDGGAVEQIQFVSMLMSAEISDARLQPDVEIDGFTWYKHDQPRTPFDSDPEGVAWVLEDPPPGFRLTQSRVRTLPGADHPVEHLVFSDGLASVSVFVEPANEADADLAGLSRMGAAHAFTLTLDGQQITAVGEVPPDTVQRIARTLKPAAVAPQ